MRRRALLLLCVAACGGGGGGGGGGGTGPSLDDFQQAAHDAECTYDVGCGLFADKASCDAYLQVVEDPSAQAEVDAGKTTYDPGAAGTCFAAIAGASCDQTQQSARELPDACNHIFTGNGQMDDACASGNECASGNCTIPSGTPGDCRQGTCGPARVIAQIGESCAIHSCAPASFCNAAETCAALVPQNTPCDFDTDCDYGLGCLGTTGAKTCQPVPHIGSACPDMECAEVNSNCGGAGTCVALGLPGAACVADIDCTSFGQCDTTAMMCTNFPSLGMACESVCTGDSWCNMSGGPGTCAAPQANGATCAGDDECVSTFCNSAKVCADREVCI